MMELKMYLLNIFIDAVPMCYDGLSTCAEKQKYQERIARDLLIEHEKIINMTGKRPVFFVDGVESKINGKLYDYSI